VTVAHFNSRCWEFRSGISTCTARIKGLKILVQQERGHCLNEKWDKIHSVCVECLIGKQNKPILFKVTEPITAILTWPRPLRNCRKCVACPANTHTHTHTQCCKCAEPLVLGNSIYLHHHLPLRRVRCSNCLTHWLVDPCLDVTRELAHEH